MFIIFYPKVSENMASEYNFEPVKGSLGVSRPVSTAEVTYSVISTWKDPFLSKFKYNHGSNRENFDRSLEPFYAPVAADLYLAPTQKEFETKKELYIKKRADETVLRISTTKQLVIASFFDPIFVVLIFLIIIKNWRLAPCIVIVFGWVIVRYLLHSEIFGISNSLLFKVLAAYTVTASISCLLIRGISKITMFKFYY